MSGQPDPRPDRADRWVDLVLRGAGALLAVLGGFGTAALAVLLVPLRVADLPLVGGVSGGAGTVRVPVALVIAVGGVLFLVWFSRRATGLRWGGLLPAVGWFALIMLAVRATDEGDRLLMPDDWVATVAIFAGTVVLVVTLVTGWAQRPASPPRR